MMVAGGLGWVVVYPLNRWSEAGLLGEIGLSEIFMKHNYRAVAVKKDQKLRHGVNCIKAPHRLKYGYLHAEDDDTLFNIDGQDYCGRCHVWMGYRRREKL